MRNEMKRKEKKKKRKKKRKGKEKRARGGQTHLYQGVTHPETNVHICTGYVTRYKCASLILYQIVCTSSMPGTNEGCGRVQMSIFSVVLPMESGGGCRGGSLSIRE
jgi:hypothetical protein